MPITHKWNGTVLTITSDSGSSSMDLKGAKGDDGARGAQGIKGERGGGALINDNVVSKDEVWSSSAIMDRFAEGFAYEGNPVVCNALPNTPFDITTNIEVKQEGSGTPYPAGGGKNLLDNVVIHNTVWLKDDIELTAGITYTLSVQETAKELYFSNEDGTIDYAAAYNTKSLTYTPEISGIYKLFAKFDKDANLSFNMMLEIGETATAYEPYENIRPIVGMDAVKVVRCGKNLLDNVRYYDNTHTDIKAQYDNPLLLKAGIKYVLSTNNKADGLFFVDAMGDGSLEGQYLLNYQYETAKLEYTPTKDIYCIFVAIFNSGVPDGTTIQLELENATTYEPYKGNTYTMELGQTVYSGSIDWNRGVMVVDREAITLNELTMSYKGSSHNYFEITMPENAATEPDSFISEAYKNVGIAYYSSMPTMATGSLGIFKEDRVWRLKDTRYTSVEELKAESGDIKICYKLAEPQEIQLTPQVIRALSGTNTLYTDATNLLVFGRVDTMATIKALEDRIAALEAAGGE